MKSHNEMMIAKANRRAARVAAMCASGMTQVQIAAKLKVTRQRVAQILKRAREGK